MDHSASARPVQENGGKTYEKIFESVKSYIVENHLKPGDRLPKEVDLCHELQVSRNTMREALKSLQKLGIIESKPKEGMIIREFNYDPIIENLEYSLMINNQKLIDLINLRIKLELAYLEEAIQRATYDQITRLNGIVDKMVQKAGQGEKLLEEDMLFHLEMYSHIDNGLTKDLISLFWRLLIKIQNQHKEFDFDPVPQQTVEVHKNILAQFSLKNIDVCRDSLLSHYYVRDRLRMYTMNSHIDIPERANDGQPSHSLGQILKQKGSPSPNVRQQIEKYLKIHKHATHRQLMAVLEKDAAFSELSAEKAARKISNTLQAMKKDGYLETIGAKSGTVWYLKN